MKVWVVQEAGGPFIEEERALPELRAGEVLLKVAASGVNPLDTKIRADKAAHAKQPLPAVLGIDVAGTVESVAPDVTAFVPGDEVFGMAGGVGGIQGSLAEFMVADADLLARKPKSLTMRKAAALPLSVITAWEGLVDRAGVHPGQSVLVHAGAGGVGHVVVQLAAAYGANVFATVSRDKFSIVEGYGATPIDYTALSPADYIERYSGGEGFDIVYDTVGGAILDASFLATKRYTGHAVSCLGWGTHALAPLSFRGATYSGVFTLMPLLTGKHRDHHGHILSKAASLVEEGKLAPLMNPSVFTTSDILEAHRVVEQGSLGKVVVQIV